MATVVIMQMPIVATVARLRTVGRMSDASLVSVLTPLVASRASAIAPMYLQSTGLNTP